MRSFRAESKVEGELEGLVPQGIDEGVFAALAGVRAVEAGDGASRASCLRGTWSWRSCSPRRCVAAR